MIEEEKELVSFEFSEFILTAVRRNRTPTRSMKQSKHIHFSLLEYLPRRGLLESWFLGVSFWGPKELKCMVGGITFFSVKWWASWCAEPIQKNGCSSRQPIQRKAWNKVWHYRSTWVLRTKNKSKNSWVWLKFWNLPGRPRDPARYLSCYTKWRLYNY